MKYRKPFHNETGFMSLKTGLMTAGAFLATASMGTAILVGVPTAQPGNVFTDDKSGFCVTATLESDDSYFAQRGNCGTDETPEPEPLPEVPEISPEPIPEPTPTPEPEPVLPPPPPPPVINSDQIMVATWDTSLAFNCQEITLPIYGGVNTKIQWGQDAIPIKLNTDKPTHKFNAPHGPKEIIIDGTFDNWGEVGWPDANCLVSVDQWENTETKTLNHAFHRANNLKHVEAIPSTTTDLTGAFGSITNNFTLGNLQTSNVTKMNSMFSTSVKFNQPLNFDTSNVTDMKYMFFDAKEFNQSLNFDTSNVTNMTNMFSGASLFNQDLSHWDVSRVTVKSNFSSGTNWKLPKPNFNQ